MERGAQVRGVVAGAVPCAGSIIFDAAGRLLLVRRRNAPSAGLWCEPSGRCEAGETAEQACVRETREETGLVVRVLRPVGSVLINGADGRHYDIADFECEVVGGSLCAGDDAEQVRWVTAAQFDALPLVPMLATTLRDWGCLPRC